MDKEKHKIIHKIADEILVGDITKVDLVCPFCVERSLIFSFTQIDEHRYGLYIHCRKCNFLIHFSLASKPKNYDEKYIIKEYQEYQDKIIEKVKLNSSYQRLLNKGNSIKS